MREILFRGQTRKKGQKVWMDGTPVDGEWVYGGVLQGVGDFSIIYGGNHQNDPGEDLQKWGVYTDTLGQFTGLTDKNGKKVFEGDILKFTDVKYEYEWIGRVEFGNPNEEYNWGFQLVYIKGEKPNTDILCWFDMEEAGAFAEVIGNIHDNPELLENP